MSNRRLTEPQLKALRWLTPGAVMEAPRSVSAALNSLTMYHKDLAISAWEKTPRGRTYLGYRLTEFGVEERARRLVS